MQDPLPTQAKGPNQDGDQQAFIKLFTANHRRIFGFVVSICPHWADADEIFQRVSLVLWEKWPEYQDNGKFLAWALQVARLEVVKFLSQQNRRKEIFSDEVLLAIQARTCEVSPELHERMTALQDCLMRLPEGKRSLVRQCYGGTGKIKEVALAMGLEAQVLYLKLQRIRKTLHQCVDKTLSQSG